MKDKSKVLNTYGRGEEQNSNYTVLKFLLHSCLKSANPKFPPTHNLNTFVMRL